jgi:hypothetical protein
VLPTVLDIDSVAVVKREVIHYNSHLFVVFDVDLLLEDVHHDVVLLHGREGLKHVLSQVFERHRLLEFCETNRDIEELGFSIHNFIWEINRQKDRSLLLGVLELNHLEFKLFQLFNQEIGSFLLNYK